MRTVAFLLIVAITAGCGRGIVCAFDCRDLGTSQHTATCHGGDRQPAQLAASSSAHHDCGHDGDVVLLVALKTSGSLVTAFESAATPTLLTLFDARATNRPQITARPPGTLARHASSRPTILRI
jgi:hypothetical protein